MSIHVHRDLRLQSFNTVKDYVDGLEYECNWSIEEDSGKFKVEMFGTYKLYGDVRAVGSMETKHMRIANFTLPFEQMETLHKVLGRTIREAKKDLK